VAHLHLRFACIAVVPVSFRKQNVELIYHCSLEFIIGLLHHLAEGLLTIAHSRVKTASLLEALILLFSLKYNYFTTLPHRFFFHFH
jgi:hypothetical protein